VTEVAIDLNGANAPDGAKDTVNVFGTPGDDKFILSGNTNQVQVTGVAATVKVTGFEIGSDELIVNGLAGNDILDASLVESGSMDITLNGGLGDDTLIGGDGDDVLIGGDGNDHIYGGPGDDVIIWNPGDDNDVIEGEEGFDTLVFHGANIAEKIDISSNTGRGRLTRDVANIVMDFNGVEAVQFSAVGGADQINIADLSGTHIKRVDLDFAAPAGSGTPDNAVDVITIHGTTGDDAVVLSGTSALMQVTGLAATINITAADATLDQLILNLHEGDDVADASALQSAILLSIFGGPGDDVLIGSEGVDSLFGEGGDDILIGGPGVDLLDGGSGNNVIIQD
jgi:Ca2+-binding RTX toxin-like protein